MNFDKIGCRVSLNGNVMAVVEPWDVGTHHRCHVRIDSSAESSHGASCLKIGAMEPSASAVTHCGTSRGAVKHAYLIDALADDALDASVPGGGDGDAPLVLVQLLPHLLHRRVSAVVVPGEWSGRIK